MTTDDKLSLLYKDAMYFHLIKNGYNSNEAKIIVGKIHNMNEEI